MTRRGGWRAFPICADDAAIAIANFRLDGDVKLRISRLSMLVKVVLPVTPARSPA
jgi:hypothetical protein